MGDVNVYGEWLGPCVRARVRVSCSVRCTERIWLQLEIGSGCDVRVSPRLRFHFMVWCG